MYSSEAAKIRPRILKYLEGKSVLDLGCGVEKIVPWATGVDNHSEGKAKPDIVASVDPVSRALDFLHKRPGGGYFEVVFSSHTLEHLRSPIGETIHYWLCFVRPGGFLILYLPDERHYVYDSRYPKARNPAHVHLLTLDTLVWYVEQIPGATVVEKFLDAETPGHYSFLVVIQRGV